MFVARLQLLTDMEENVTFNLSELEPKFQSANVSHTEGVASARETLRISLQTSRRMSRRNGDLMSIKEVVSRVFLSGMLVSNYRKARERNLPTLSRTINTYWSSSLDSESDDSVILYLPALSSQLSRGKPSVCSYYVGAYTSSTRLYSSFDPRSGRG